MGDLRGVDLAGRVFERLTVLGKGEKAKQGQTRWVCQCSCGNTTLVRGRDLKNGHTKSCGCYGLSKTNQTCTTHGKSKSSEYRIWSLMKYRCYDVRCKQYSYYGGKGISVCDRWRESFENFYADMGDRPSELYSLDRYPNKNGNYEPGNCRWATKQEQANNTARNRFFTHNGETKTLREWSVLFGAADSNVSRMLKNKPFEMVYKHYMPCTRI
jgi:hypothetical protein